MFPNALPPPNPAFVLLLNALLLVLPKPPDGLPKALFELFAVLLPNRPPDVVVLEPKGFEFAVLFPKREVPVLELPPKPEDEIVSRFADMVALRMTLR